MGTKPGTKQNMIKNQMKARDTTFVNNFWGQDDIGISALKGRVQDGTQSMEELLSYYNERILIEREYNKKLENLSRKAIATHEIGTLKNSFDKLLTENSNMVNFNRNFIKNLQYTNSDALNQFMGNYRSQREKIDNKISSIKNKKDKAYQDLAHFKAKYQSECSKLKVINLQNQTLLGKELERNQAKSVKLQQSITLSRKEYELAVRNYKEIQEQFVRDWRIACSNFELLDFERIDFLKKNLCKYSNNIAINCVENDQAVDNIRKVLAACNPLKDISSFTANYGTSNKIHNPPSFISFERGEEDKDFGFTIANFDNNHNNEIYHNNFDGDNTLSSIPPPQPQPQQRNTSPPKSTNPILNNQLPPPQFNLNIPIGNGNGKAAKRMSNPLNLDHEEEEEDEVFSNPSKFRTSSNYSNPTTVSNYSQNSNSTERTWSSPRRNRRSIQQEINMKSKELPITPSPTKDTSNKRVPIMKDFSIDFIAKCLEDLNNGGDGDVSQYRKSVRSVAASEPINQYHTKSDFINDSNEVAVNFSERGRRTAQEQADISPSRVSRSLSRGNTRQSYKNLNEIASSEFELTPTGKPFLAKAKAKYSFKPQTEGELGFRKGAKMFVLYKQTDGWFKCELLKNGEIGLVPNNYIEEGNLF